MSAAPGDRAKRDQAHRDQLAEYVRRVVDEAPPLTAEQRAQIARILANAPHNHREHP